MPHFHSTSTYPGIYSYVTASEENNNNTQQEVVIEPVDVKSLGMEDFFNICLNNYLQETDREEIEAKLNLSMEDEQFFVKMFQKSYLKKTSDEINDYIDKEINKSVDKALEGDLAGAYNNFLKFTMFTENENAYIYSKEGENSPQKLQGGVAAQRRLGFAQSGYASARRGLPSATEQYLQGYGCHLFRNDRRRRRLLPGLPPCARACVSGGPGRRP